MEQLNVTPAGNIPPMSLRDLAVVLVKHYGLHSGRYEVSVSFQFAVGGVGEPANLSPGVMLALRGVGLAPVQHETPNAVDAAEVNPAPESAVSSKPSKPSKPSKVAKLAPASRKK